MEDSRTGTGMRGRNGILALVAECLDQPPGTERPVTMLVGPRGSGASEAHGAVMGRFGPEHPFAYLNFAADQALLPRYALALIARQLERRLPQYRVSRFPRLTLGLLASDRELRMPDRSQGRRAVQRQLEDFRRQAEDRHGDYLSAFLEVAGSALGAPNGAPAVVAALLRDAAARGGRRLPGRVFAGAPQWFGDHPLVPSRDAWDALLELNMWRHSGSEQEKRILDRVLFAAFLDDLRHDTARWFAPGSYLLLLDNCHTDQGRLFLELLTGARRDAALTGAVCDPLTVVGSSNRWLENWGSSAGDQWPWRLRGPDRAGLADWRERRPAHDSDDSWWYPLRLRDLTLDEVRTGIELASPRHSGLAPFVYRLTRGLPVAVRQVMDVLDLANTPRRGSGEFDLWLRSLPGRRMRRTPHDTLADAALDHLLEDFPQTQREALVRCAAARDLSMGSRVLGAVSPGGAGESLFNEVRSRWLLEPGHAQPRLHPWLRRLLLWRLAADPGEWDAVHELMADHFEAEGRFEETMYHRLAAHRVEDVVEQMAVRFRELSAARWIRLFNAVTSAPNRLPADRSPLELLGELAPEAPTHSITDVSVIRGLVCARWLWSDPLGDPGLRLNSVIAAKYDRLSELRGSEIVALYDEAERYRHWRHPLTLADEG
ncbi:hypothetical protein [Streptomyces barkulensis]|uniref:hypothetical protein n=1 Tax=Streptomyces barkulensis TaxID=1257026 RepID=UPI000C6D76AD|nr:hypothetical protein [Streptomyces barkulensis]